MEDYKNILGKYLPNESVALAFEWIQEYKVHLRISKQRSTKLGDYRPAYKGQPHRISINHNLNKYSFLITFVHELAHLIVNENFSRRAKPHGKEWKNTFRELMDPVFELDFFPADIKTALHKYLKNAAASSTSNLNLSRILRNYDEEEQNGIEVEQLPEGSMFIIPNGKAFKKLEKRRKRYKCQSLENGKFYLFDPLALVHPIDP